MPQRRARLRSVRPAPTKSTTASASSSTTKTACVRCRAPLEPRPPSFKVLFWSGDAVFRAGARPKSTRSEEHTSELQSRLHLVCRLLLEKKKQLRADPKEFRDAQIDTDKAWTVHARDRRETARGSRPVYPVEVETQAHTDVTNPLLQIVQVRGHRAAVQLAVRRQNVRRNGNVDN